MITKTSHYSEQGDEAELSRFLSNVKKDLGGLFSPDRDLYITKAPYRLAVMGELTEEAGTLVLHYPLCESVIVAMQKRLDSRILLRNLNHQGEQIRTEEMPLDIVFDTKKLKKLMTFSASTDAKYTPWAINVLGLLAMFSAERVMEPPQQGMNIAIKSTLPLGYNATTLSAFTCATGLLLQKVYDFTIEAFRLAEISSLFFQEYFHQPIGKTPFLSAALSQKNKLFVCLCQPHEISHRELASHGIQFIGLDRVIQEHPNGETIRNCRINMALCARLIKTMMQKTKGPLLPSSYLANIPLDDWNSGISKLVPEKIFGKELRKLVRPLASFQSWILPEKNYPLRNWGSFALREHDRCLRFIKLIDSYQLDHDKAKLIEAGELLYTAQKDRENICGIQSREMNMLIDVIRSYGPEKGFYGAVSADGSEEGMITILADLEVEDHLRNLAAQYSAITGITPKLLFGSSSGALLPGIITTRYY